jgi:hypothetical protein
MLTVAYCRVSTEEQAAEGFSIEGQAEKLRAYANLHDLGEVIVITDPGKSGKDLNRPGLQQLLAMVDADHVTNVLLWRLDRLSRNLGDLIDLADRCGQHNVALHSFTEKIDLSSATGRMFYNIIGTFAQFYREQLAENVRWEPNRPCERVSGSIARRRATTSSVASSWRTGMRHGFGRSSASGLKGQVTGRSLSGRASTTRRSVRSSGHEFTSARSC